MLLKLLFDQNNQLWRYQLFIYSALEGGVISFKRIYPIWIAQKLDKENSKLEVDKEFKRYERRYGMTKLNAEKMTIENEPVEEI